MTSRPVNLSPRGVRRVRHRNDIDVRAHGGVPCDWDMEASLALETRHPFPVRLFQPSRPPPSRPAATHEVTPQFDSLRKCHSRHTSTPKAALAAKYLTLACGRDQSASLPLCHSHCLASHITWGSVGYVADRGSVPACSRGTPGSDEERRRQLSLTFKSLTACPSEIQT